MTIVDRRSPSPQSVTRVLQILDVLSANPDPMSLADLSRDLETPKSSLAALLRGLAEHDFVTLADGVYRLGPGAFGLGSALLEARRRFPSADLIRAGMRRLAARSGETVIFGVCEGQGDTITYVDVIESRNTVRFAVSAGDRRPLYCTSGGRALLAERGAEARSEYLARLKPQRLTSHTQITKRDILTALDAVTATGFAQTLDQTAEGVSGTASAIRDAAGVAIGALIVAAPGSRSSDRQAELARMVLEEATAISRSLGYRAPPARG